MLCADAAEEFARQIGLAPFAPAGVHVEFEEHVPMRFGDVASGQPIEFDAALANSGALLAQILALRRRQFAEEFIEAAIAAILPVKLLVGAQQIAKLPGGSAIRPRWEK